GPLVFGLALVLLPLVAGRGERSPLRRPWSVVIVIAIVVIIAYYGHVGHIAPWSPRLEAQPLASEVVGATTGPVADGARVFYEKGCEFCHRVAGEGGVRGPDLTYAADRLTPAQITTRIFSGAANMPSYTNNLTPDQLSSLLAFLDSRHRRPPKPTALPSNLGESVSQPVSEDSNPSTNRGQK
ncbi:MAG TPA: cytochrome c, partial [Candidatus Sulfotelmatobacter sp.]|nr:cytochrome c [Candidatus Sulfotelmatobacter sp.]